MLDELLNIDGRKANCVQDLGGSLRTPNLGTGPKLKRETSVNGRIKEQNRRYTYHPEPRG